MRFVLFKVSTSFALTSALILLITSQLVWSEDAEPSDPGFSITVESQQSYEGACNKLIVAGNDQTGVCGQSLVIVIMTNGSVSITLQQGNQDLGLFGAETNANLYSIYGAFVNGTDNIPLQGSCEQVSMINSDPVLTCAMTDEQGSPWEIQFIIPD